MRSPAAAIAWEFRQRHRWPLIVLAGYVLVLGMSKLLILGPGQPVRLDPPDGLAGALIAPFSMTFMYFLAVFSFGRAGDLAARQSIYPARMFTLPVRTAALAGWPMLYGTVAMASLWLAAALFARWPWGIAVPWIWPALLAAAFLAWTQALLWMPYGLRGLRVLVTVLWLVALDAVVLLALHYKAPEPVMVAFLAPQIPLAYLAACFAVARARRGDVPDWRGAFVRIGRRADVPPRRRAPFSSPARAQRWFEWRQQGRSLPAWVGLLLPFELALLVVTPELVFPTLLGMLLTPPVMAGFAAATARPSNPQGRDAYGVAPFLATRPLTSAALTAAKLKMAIGSTLAAWLLVLVAIPLGLTLSGTWPVVIERARQGIETVGTLRAIVIALLGVSGLLASTWKQLVQNLCIGLTGRAWVIKASVFLSLSVLTLLGPIAQWIDDNRDVRAWLWDAFLFLPAVGVGCKMAAAAFAATRLWEGRLLGDRALITGAAGWMAAVLALYGVLVWLVATPFIPRYLLALVAILAIPLVRLAAAPLALQWNRHR